MIFTNEIFTPTPSYPTYPPYHSGLYLEDYFINEFKKDSNKIERDFIGISWTTLYCEGKTKGLQDFLNSLPRDRKYFTVSQHDDAPAHILPPDTLCFSAGGNVRGNNVIPIPLICSSLPNTISEQRKKEILASFVGSNTHRIRMKLFEQYKNSKTIIVNMKGWTPSVSNDDFLTFINLTKNSTFCICPRGYGLNSFRLYEAMQLGAIPVIVTDELYLPWVDELNWNEFAVIVHENFINNLEDILQSYSDDLISKMQNKLKEVYPKYFNMSGMYYNILKRIK